MAGTSIALILSYGNSADLARWAHVDEVEWVRQPAGPPAADPNHCLKDARESVLDWLRRRRITDSGRRRLLIALARAEEELLETHVENALDVYDSVADDLSLDRALAIYFDAVEIDETQAATVARMVIARLESSDSGHRRSPAPGPRRRRR